MDNVYSPAYELLNREQHEILDRLAVRFEEEWKQGRQPCIEEYLAGEPEIDAFRGSVLQELLALELEYRSRRGERLELKPYQERFPDELADVRSAFVAFSREGKNHAPSAATPCGSQDVPTQDMDHVQKGGASAREACSCQPTGPQDGALPKHLGRYEILRLIASGGFGRVLLAKDPDLDRLVAIKIAHHGLFISQEEVDQYLKEARLAARLSHPNIVAIHYVGSSGELGCYIVMDYVDGGPLDVEEVASRSDMAEVASLVAQIADAVHHAHTKGLVHRDLKPGNLLIDSRGIPHVVDFGLAVHESEQYDHEGEISGTPPYMSPEQVRGLSHQLDGRTDVWSLGVLLYELLTGRKPFQGDTRTRVFDEILHRDPKPLRQINDRIPAELERVCLLALVKQPAQRYSTASDFAEDLRAALGELREPPLPKPPAPPPAPPPVAESTWSFAERVAWKRPYVLASGLVAIVLLAFVIHALLPDPRPEDTSTHTPGSASVPASAVLALTELPFSVRLADSCTHLAVNAEVGWVAAASETGDLSLFRMEGSGKLCEVIQHPHPIRAACLSEDGSLLGTLCEDQPVVYLYSTDPGFSSLATKLRPIEPFGFLRSSEPSSLAVVDVHDKLIMLRDAKTGVMQSRLYSDAVNGIQFAQRNAAAVFAGYDRVNHSCAVTFCVSGTTLPTGAEPIHSFDVAPDGAQIVVGGYSPQAGVRVYRGETSTQLNSVDTQPLWYHNVAFFDEGKRVVAVSRCRATDEWPGRTVIRAWREDAGWQQEQVLNGTIAREATLTAFALKQNLLFLAFDTWIVAYRLEAP